MLEPNKPEMAPESPVRLLLVDLCGTLYDSNTTFDFLHYFLSDDADYKRFESANKRFVSRLFNRLRPGDARRAKAISFLEGHSRTKLLQAAHTFLESVPDIADVRRYVHKLSPDFDRTLLLSSSLDFIVEAASEILGFDDFRASRLRYSGGICMGAFDADLLGAKDRLIVREFASGDCTLITDNADDAACKRVVARLIGVARAGDERAFGFWKRHADDIIVYER